MLQTQELDRRLRQREWEKIYKSLHHAGWAPLDHVLESSECDEIINLYNEETLFRKHVLLARWGFGRGEYKYFSYPLPDVIQKLRTLLYTYLLPVANIWEETLTQRVFPKTHEGFLNICKFEEQNLPTPLLFKYEAGDYNGLHQDIHGRCTFPLQVTFLLSQPGQDFHGGELVVTDQRQRLLTKAQVVPLLKKGNAIILSTSKRPCFAQNERNYFYTMRHAMSPITGGCRYALGIIFHDAVEA